MSRSAPSQPSTPLRWAVLGAGAVGCLWAAHLKRFAGVTPTLLLRRPTSGRRSDTSPSWLFSHVDVQLESPENERWWSSLPAQYCDGQARRDRFDVIVLTTKSYDAEEALTLARPVLAPGARVVVLTNGVLAVHEALRKAHGDLSFLLGSTTHGSLRVGPLHVRHTGRGQTWFGSLGSSNYFASLDWLDHSVPPPEPLPYPSDSTSQAVPDASAGAVATLPETYLTSSESSHVYQAPLRGESTIPSEWSDVVPVLTATGLGAEWDPLITRRLWIKLAVNCAINPSTALARIPNGALQSAAGIYLVRQVSSEIAELMTALNMPMSATDIEWEIMRVVRNTSRNHSSMYQDVTHTRKTEAAMIMGYVAAQADKAGISLPTIRTLDSLVSLVEWVRVQASQP